jgi:chromosome segregation ATPase
MEIEEVVKRLEWLENERRKEKSTMAALEEKIANLEGNLPPLMLQVKEISGEMSRLTVLLNRFDTVDTAIAQIRVDYNRQIEAIEKQRADHDREVEKVRRGDLEIINKSLGELRKFGDVIPEFRKGIQARIEEVFRLGKQIDDLRKNLEEGKRSEDEYHHTQRILEESRRQDAKRVTDVQGEVSALRKRTDEQRGKVDLASESVRKLELRISELLAGETERKATIMSFIEKTNLAQVDRDRIWKDWGDRFEEINQKSAALDAQIQVVDAANRAVRRSQESFDDITQRFERRVNEITEMQRLTEERFRQEWVNFKADDQKRWTNYTLAQEEQHRETFRLADKQADRLTVLEDFVQEFRDSLHVILEDTQSRLQGLLGLSHQWLDDYERAHGSSRQQGSK